MSNTAPNGVDDSKEAKIRSYLDHLGDLYLSGTTSSEIPEVLADQGGILALAAKDAERIRSATVLGFINVERDWANKESAAEIQWKSHSRKIAALARRQNWSAQRAAQAYVNAFTTGGGDVQDEATISRMMSQTMSGTAWLDKLAEGHAEAVEESEVMTDTLAGITAGVAELAGSDHRRAMALGSMLHNLAQPLYAAEGHSRYEPEPPGGWEPKLRPFSPTGKSKSRKKDSVSAPQSRSTAGANPSSIERGLTPILTPPERTRLEVRSVFPTVSDPTDERPWQIPPPWPGTRGTSNRGISEELPPQPQRRGGKTSPPKKQLDAYVQEFVSRPELANKVRDADSLRALRDIFRRSHGVSESGNGLKFTETRSAAAELATLVRKAKDPSVTKIEIVPSSRVRTPDTRITYGEGPNARVVPTEQFALTGSSRGLKPKRGVVAEQKWSPDRRLGSAILGKARDTSARPSQIHGGGEIVGQIFFRDFSQGSFTGQADATMAKIAGNLKNLSHVQAIELSAIETRPESPTATVRTTLRYIRRPDGSYFRLP